MQLVVSGSTIAVPSRNARLTVTDNSGVVLFTGYIATEPAQMLTGAGTTGAVYVLEVSAISDEILLNRQSVPQTRATAGQTVSELFQTLTNRVNPGALSITTPAIKNLVGHFIPDPRMNWAENAGKLASMTRTAYYAISGTLNLAPVGNTTHALSEADGTLQVEALQATQAKTLANDVTLCGEEEPAAYVTEMFQGDGRLPSSS